MIANLNDSLATLRLHYLAAHYDEFAKTAIKQRMGPTEIIEAIIKNEIQERSRRLINARLTRAKIGKFKTMADFDWSWPKFIPRERIERLFKLDFIAEPLNVILVSTAGLGKTMIAKNLAYEAAIKGHDVLFVEASEMISDLQQQDSPSGFKRRLGRYTKPSLLVIDELGYLSFCAQAADLLFQVVNRRHERNSTIITTNKVFKEWGEVFPGASCVVAMVDRLTHHASIISIDGDSYRRKEAIGTKQRKKGTKNEK